MSRSLLILGAAGQLGQALLARFEAWPAWRSVGLDQDQLDITDPDAVRAAVREIRPDWVINCAARTHVDGCETDPSSHRINAEAVAWLAEACDTAGAGLVQISTDYVFDGRSSRPYREEDPAGPLNFYARSKLAAEENARRCRRHLITRTAWLYGPGGRNFVRTILNRAAEGSSIRVVHDQIGSPSYAPDMAECIGRLLAAGAEGVFHIVNAGQASWYELAREAIRLAGINVDVIPITTTEYGGTVSRPAFSVLDCSKYIALTHHVPREWRDALREYVPLVVQQ